ncbi:YIP1 family protein [Myxococcus stipitatus]|uniref:YIP1 family protein n=1 Tax=Myxococcus stipitatus TaxID=83455 RepID=UPI0030D2B14A
MSPISCPSCQAPVALGELRCRACESSLLMAPPPDSGAAVCAVHPAWVSVQSCARCGAFACAACLRSGPKGALYCVRCQERSQHEPLPWDQREELGLMKAFWRTCVEVMLRPGAAFTRMQPEGRVRDSLLFVLLSTFTGYFTTVVLYFAILMAFPNFEKVFSHGQQRMDTGSFRLAIGALFIFWWVMAPLGNMAGTLLAAGMDNLVLRMTGAPSSFNTTLRGHAFSQGVFLLGLIPFCSLYVTPLWSIGVRIMAYQKLYRLGWGRATVGALVGPLLLCGLFLGGYTALWMFIASTGKGLS